MNENVLSLKVKLEMPKVLGKIELPVNSSTLPVKRTQENFFLPNDKCCYCNRTFDKKNKATKEHIVPKSKGGDSTLKNLKPCCFECNSLRSNLTHTEFKAVIRLLKKLMKKTITLTIEDCDVILNNISKYDGDYYKQFR